MEYSMVEFRKSVRLILSIEQQIGEYVNVVALMTLLQNAKTKCRLDAAQKGVRINSTFEAEMIAVWQQESKAIRTR